MKRTFLLSRRAFCANGAEGSASNSLHYEVQPELRGDRPVAKTQAKKQLVPVTGGSTKACLVVDVNGSSFGGEPACQVHAHGPRCCCDLTGLVRCGAVFCPIACKQPQKDLSSTLQTEQVQTYRRACALSLYCCRPSEETHPVCTPEC